MGPGADPDRPGELGAPLDAAAAVLLSGDAVHYVRLANPISRGGPVQSFEATFADPAAARRQWYVEEGGTEGAVRARALSCCRRRPAAARSSSPGWKAAPDMGTRWWLPVALAKDEPREELTWRASVHRSGDYLVVTEVANLLIQAVGYGLHVTYPDERGTARGTRCPTPPSWTGAPTTGRSPGTAGRSCSCVDGTRIWAAPQRGPCASSSWARRRSIPSTAGRSASRSRRYASFLERR